MSDIQTELFDTLDRLCEAQCTRALRASAEQGQWPAELWQALDELGLVRAMLPESAGGSALDFDDAMAVLRRCAWHALPLPLGETLLAGRLLAAAGLEVPQGPLAVAPPGGPALRLAPGPRGLRISGLARHVPWAPACAHAVLVADSAQGPQLVLVATEAATVQADRSLAGEPRASLAFEDSPIEALAPFEGGAERVLAEGALLRSVQMAGALERLLAHSVQYANERVQFGKPIGKFQAVQHMLAELAGQVAASRALTDLAIEASAVRADAFTVAAAKARVGEAAGKGAEIAHQVHGAMGFTHEHTLHYSTRRLWAWREEFGNESFWQVRLARSVAALGADALWARVTAPA